MPFPWLAALKVVPWADVIANAPQIAGGAKQLWSRLRQPPEPSPAPPPGASVDAGQDARLAALEQSLAEAHAQLQETARLVHAMAEQNARLVEGLELVRRRQIRLVWIAVAALVLATLTLAAVVHASLSP